MYVDAKKIKDRIWISERGKDGIRKINTHRPEYVFYYPDQDGKHISMYGDKLSKYTSFNFFEHRAALANVHDNDKLETFESDVNPVYRVLENRYPTNDAPDLHITIFDIETDRDPELGFSTIDNPYAPMTANTIWNSWEDQYYTLIVPPPNLTMSECRKLLDGDLYQNEDGSLTAKRPAGDCMAPMTEDDGFFVVENEEQLIRVSIELWEDSDVLSGWNSAWYDIPYFIHRMRIVLGDETIQKIAMEKGTPEHPYNPSENSRYWINQLCKFPCPPSLRIAEHYGNMEKTYNLHGRIHLDYLELYKKFTFGELHSYTLDSVLQLEVNQTKVPYDGSLDQLYRNDFRLFSAYSRQDVSGLVAMDQKLKFINLANDMAHLAGVTIDQVLGTVALVEQAMLKELHKRGEIATDRKEKSQDYPIPGAYVVSPHKGLYEWLVSYDYNSLYPTIIRMLNLSPETIVGWVQPTKTLEKLFQYMADGMDGATAWSTFFGTDEYNMVVDKSPDMVTLIMEEDGETIVLTGAELHEIIEDNNWLITAFGLVMHRDKQGIIPYCLEKWYKQRTTYKASAKAAYKKSMTLDDGAEKDKLLAEYEYWDTRQLIQKLLLNSSYGTILNAYFRFYDLRIGSSVTMSGRVCLSAMVNHADHLLNTETFHNI